MGRFELFRRSKKFKLSAVLVLSTSKKFNSTGTKKLEKVLLLKLVFSYASEHEPKAL